MKIRRGQIVTHQGNPWHVDKVLIPTRVGCKEKAWLQASPIRDGQVLGRSSKTIGDNFEVI